MLYNVNTQDLVYRLRKRAEINRQLSKQRSAHDSDPTRVADLLEEAALEISSLRALVHLDQTGDILSSVEYIPDHKEEALAFLARVGGISSWIEVNQSDWAQIIAATAGLTPEAGDCGLHCYNNIFMIDGVRYDIIYDHTSQQPISIMSKPA